MRKFTPALSLLCSLALAGCASPYISPTSGPVAWVRLIDDYPGHARRINDSGECGKDSKSVITNDWFAVPANREISFLKAYAVPFYSVCFIRSQMLLKEGQRVALQYSFRRNAFGGSCHAQATEQTSDGKSIGQFQLLALKDKPCLAR